MKLELIEKKDHNETQQQGTSKTLAGWEYAHLVEDQYARREHTRFQPVDGVPLNFN